MTTVFNGTTPAAGSWTPGSGGVAASAYTGSDGIASMRFTCPFSTTAGARQLWDVVPTAGNFTANDQIVLKIKVSVPAALYNVVLYFSSSGEAFSSFYSASYAANVGSEWVDVVVLKSDFSATGSPNWAAIDLVRLAVYPNKQIDTYAYVASLEGRTGYPVAYVGQVGPYTDVATASAGIKSRISYPNVSAASALVDQAVVLAGVGDQTSISQGRALMQKAWALVQYEVDEFRGIWLPWGTGTTNSASPSTRLRRWSVGIQAVYDQGYNALMPNMAGPGGAWYASSLVPHRAGVDSEGDYLSEILSYAAPLGVEVHPWIECWRFSEYFKDAGASAATARAGGLLAIDSAGAEIYPPTLDWGNPINWASMQAIIVEIATNYAVAGVHLDYNRGPDGYGGSYTAASRAAYQTWSGSTVAVWPTDVLVGGSRYTSWNNWQRSLFTGFIASVRSAVRAVKPAMQVSAAVLGDPVIAKSGRLTDGLETLFQDWGTWVSDGSVDWISPFAYAPTVYQAKTLVLIQSDEVANPNVKLYPGLQIGITDTTGVLDPGISTDQILAVRGAGLTGFCNYGWQDLYESADGTGDYLIQGVLGGTLRGGVLSLSGGELTLAGLVLSLAGSTGFVGITDLPHPPTSADPANFAVRAEEFFAALPTFITQANSLLSAVGESSSTATAQAAAAAAAQALATAAASAAATASGRATAASAATKWVTGTTYAVGAMVWSPAAGFIYVRLVAGAGTTDPASDSTNWSLAAVSAPVIVSVTASSRNMLVNEHSILLSTDATTATLPASPAAGDLCWVTVANGRGDNVVGRNGKKIMSLDENLTLTFATATVRLRYINSTIGWAL